MQRRINRLSRGVPKSRPEVLGGFVKLNYPSVARAQASDEVSATRPSAGVFGQPTERVSFLREVRSAYGTRSSLVNYVPSAEAWPE